MSLRVRLLVATGVALLIGLVVVDLITYVMVSRSQLQQVDDALNRAHTPIEQLAVGDERSRQAISAIAPGLFVGIVDRGGVITFSVDGGRAGRDSVIVDLSGVSKKRGFQTVGGNADDEVRVRIDPIADGSTLVVGQSLHEVNETRSRLLGVLAAASTAALGSVLVVAWWLIGAGLRPLRAVEQSAAAITDSDLGDQRVPGDKHTSEVGSLARALNAMLDRLAQAQTDREATMSDLRASEARMRQFVADASHELRTPIAATSAYAELFDKGARDRPEDLARSMTGIRSETARMSHLVDDLLLLAQLDEQRPLSREQVDMTEVVLMAVDATRAIDPTRTITPRIEGVLTVSGDPLRLRQVVDNLLANVRAHTPPGTPCVISLQSTDDGVVVEVGDSGAGMSDEGLTHLFDRFYRADPARARLGGGSGLGLSIVQAIVAAHGGTVTAHHNQPTGLSVRVVLP